MTDSAPTFRPEIHVKIGQLTGPKGYLVVPPAHPWASKAPETLGVHDVTYHALASSLFPDQYPSGSMAIGIDTQDRLAAGDDLTLMKQVSHALIIARMSAITLMPPEGVSWSNSASREKSVDRTGEHGTREIQSLAGDLVGALPRDCGVTLLVRPNSGQFVAHLSLPTSTNTITCPCPGTFKASLRAAIALARTCPSVL